MTMVSHAPPMQEAVPPPPEWLARLAHDMRGSIGPIRMSAQMLEDSALGVEHVPELGKVIERQANRLQHIADDLDDILRIGLGSFHSEPTACDLRHVVEDAVVAAARFAECMGRRSRPFALRESATLIVVDADEKRLGQLIAQLLLAVTPLGDSEAVVECWIACELAEDAAVVRIHDAARRIYRSAGIDFLTLGKLPEDPGVLSMASVIGRQIAVDHGADIDTRDEEDGRIGELLLHIPLTGVRR